MKMDNLSEELFCITHHRGKKCKWVYAEDKVKEIMEEIIKELWEHEGTFEGVKCKTCLPLDWVEEVIKRKLGERFEDDVL